MMCSHAPDTTSPMANPENPLTKPPANAAKTKMPQVNPSMDRPPQPSVAFEDLGARVDPAGVRNDQRPVLCLQERSPDLTRPDDEVPQAVKPLDDDVHESASSRASRAADRANALAASARAAFSARRS